jgi:hypothetical protein
MWVIDNPAVEVCWWINVCAGLLALTELSRQLAHLVDDYVLFDGTNNNAILLESRKNNESYAGDVKCKLVFRVESTEQKTAS